MFTAKGLALGYTVDVLGQLKEVRRRLHCGSAGTAEGGKKKALFTSVEIH